MGTQENKTSASIRLRPVEKDDVDFILKVENDASQWGANGIMAPWSRTKIEEYVMNYTADPFADGQIRFVVADDNNIRIGLVDLYDISPLNRNALAAIYVQPAFRGLGMGKKSLNALCEYAANYLALDNIGARIAATNSVSISTFEACGFLKAGILKDWLYVCHCPTDMVVMQKRLLTDRSKQLSLHRQEVNNEESKEDRLNTEL